MNPTDFDRLKAPLPAWHPKAWWYGFMRAGIRAAAPLSKGLSIGVRHGFDSGVMLDHVYDDTAAGVGPIGRLIDRVYLNAPGWIGIRNRGELVRRTIAAELRRAAGANGTATLVDLACGGGRYVLAALADVAELKVDAILRDYREENLTTARAAAQARGIAATIEHGDAFADADLAKLPPTDVVVVSGLHEIIDDDAVVRPHFQQIARVLKPGGALILTIQPDHPQLEFIARVLTSHTGKPWVMRLRPVEVTRAWIEEAGLTVESVAMEAKGIFGVVVARKPVAP